MSLRRLLLLRPLPSTTRFYSSSFQQSPSPPRLPQAQQEEFERLQRAAEAALSSHTTSTPSPAESQTTPATNSSRHVTTPTSSSVPESPVLNKGEEQKQEQQFSGGIRKGAPPEFEGEKNPKTGEVGGPKNEPLRWGGKGDWSYNGRVTDF
ncbi:hypothetical protein QBC43DRAFT_319146 [Cladorrhinum sp. PSN259]|nr:hypothetical protein QBC43DRAFT_319146 [Cladorrhinum sp. PSN259]